MYYSIFIIIINIEYIKVFFNLCLLCLSVCLSVFYKLEIVILFFKNALFPSEEIILILLKIC